MNWWGKVVGGTFGFMMGGPLGALLGAAVGNCCDKGLAGVQSGARPGLDETERVQSVFFTATFSLMGYVTKADDRVSRDEIDMAEQVIRQMQLNPQQRTVAINLFNAGKVEGFPLQEVLAQFKHECVRRTHLAQMLLEIIVATALADGKLDARESRLLERIAGELGYSPGRFQELLQRMSGAADFAGNLSTPQKLTAAYELLGVSAQVTDDELKTAYRRQMNQHHPDKLVAKGLPEEMMEIAKRKTQDIKTAYELIKADRAKRQLH